MKKEILTSTKCTLKPAITQEFSKTGFTLAEVLITLGIIGVVAAMTIPTLLTRLNQIKLKSQFKEGYSVLAQMVKMYNGDDERNNAANFYKSFIKYFTGVTDCGDTETNKEDTQYCIIRKSSVAGGFNRDSYYTNYAKNANSIDTVPLDDGQFYLMKNNILIMFDLNHNPHLVSIDINGKSQKPNAWGHDLFTFQLKESEKEGGYELVPMGAPGTPYENSEIYCSRTNANIRNGIGCTYYAAQDEDYFKKLP